MSDESTQAYNIAVQEETSRLRTLHPTPEDIPSCMTLFDEFLSCNMVGKQFRALYRFGEMAHCTPKFNEFKFCMSVKGLHPEQRRDEWIRHRAEWWARRRVGTSSESVWDVRAEPLGSYPPPLSHDDVTLGKLID
ncbi:hypothetical protein FA95DRAFT_1485886 [Auriscalpium vulgare]|uniref:Uncharacterized protein n=1 Tax=Auriscalpium vulgare TaxID=40419 RepID=A0ACB8S4U0_9AGAM|nr:hypothetical protein FA95DRAFT_1485886 [Auriscalpium vulgare]